MWPWSVVTGPLRLHSVEITRGRFSSLRDEAGVSNLPGGDDRHRRDPTTLPIARLLATDFEVHIDDKPTAVALDLLGLRLDSTSAAAASRGPISLSSPSFVRWQDQRLDIRA